MDTANFQNIAQIKQANVELGHYFFARDTMRFHRSKIEGRAVYGGRYFITSEQFPGDPNHGIPAGPRLFTIREANADGSISTVGEHGQFRFIEDARASVKALAKLAMNGGDDCATDGQAQSRHEHGTSDCKSPFLWQPRREPVIDPRPRAAS